MSDECVNCVVSVEIDRSFKDVSDDSVGGAC